MVLAKDLLAFDKKLLRRQVRQRRRALSVFQQRRASERLTRHLLDRPEFVSANTVAVYLAADGEIDPKPLIKVAWRLGKRVYLPVLRAGNYLRFAEYKPAARLRRNRLGIPEPAIKRFRDPRRLDLVLMPLVAFDRRGGRLGMGGGFYDRTFAFLLAESKRRPALVGLAHAFQEAESLSMEAWDVPMVAVATDRGWIKVVQS
jgi:5-formyltetrahydrofolate cyclo-ligase